jgi:3-oxoacyl-[acyl-carrier-protein] synthase-3
MFRNAAVTGWGSYTPARVLTNKDLEALVDTSDEWIRERTGIRERRIAGPGETTATMCVAAAEQALGRAGLDARDLGLVICASTTPDHLLPATACLVQRRLGAARAGAFDLNAACTGFVCALVTADQFIRCGTCDRILVVAGETLSRFLDWKDRNTCILFGDGAAAVVLEATRRPGGVLASALACQGDVGHLLAIEGGGCARPATAATVAQGDHYVRMRGHEVFKLAVRGMIESSTRALTRAGLAGPDLRKVIPHQANVRILAAVQDALRLAPGQLFLMLDRFGNTGAASVPMALAECLAAERIEPGDDLLLTAFGGGLTCASAVLRWADTDAVRRERPAA